MANNCYYEMKVTGKKEDIDRLFKDVYNGYNTCEDRKSVV